MNPTTPTKGRCARIYQTITESPLHSVQSRRHLAFLLHHDLPMLRRLAAQPTEERYRIRPNTENGKVRWVQVPRGDLKHVHRRLFCLLNRLATPDFLHSGTRGRSYITNAMAHVKASTIFKIDISKFFESVLWKDVFTFFHRMMNCSPDVAALLADICTVERRERPRNDPRKRDRHLPTGSPISQCLAYWCFSRMFEAIGRLAAARGLTLTVYVDDITLSGALVSPRTQNEVRRIINRCGLIGHKERLYRRKGLVTGAVVTPSGLRLPNRRRQQVLASAMQLRKCSTIKSRVAHLRKLVGQLWSAVELDKGFEKQAGEYTTHLEALYRRYSEFRPRSRKRSQKVVPHQPEPPCAP